MLVAATVVSFELLYAIWWVLVHLRPSKGS